MSSMTLDYTWLKEGCINDTYLNWMIGLLTARDPNIEDMNLNGVYRKFVSCGFEGCKDGKDMTSHYKRFQFVGPSDWVWDKIDESHYKPKWPKDIQWITKMN